MGDCAGVTVSCAGLRLARRRLLRRRPPRLTGNPSSGSATGELNESGAQKVGRRGGEFLVARHTTREFAWWRYSYATLRISVRDLLLGSTCELLSMYRSARTPRLQNPARNVRFRAR